MTDQQARTFAAARNYTPYDDVSARLQQFETTHDLLRYQLDGWCIWPLLRHRAAGILRNLRFVRPGTAGQQVFLRREVAILAARDLLRLAAPRQARYAVVFHDVVRSERQGDRFKDMLFDDLLLAIGNHCKIEHINNPAFALQSRRALVPTDLTSTPLRMQAALLAKARLPRAVAPLAHSLGATLRHEPALQSFSDAFVAYRLRLFYWLKRFYVWLLRRIGPAYLLIQVAYIDHAMVAAARELGIEVIEFQHGMVNRYHSGYSWSSAALPYKDRMPLPNRIFLYGDYWRQELAANGFWDTELRAVGSLRMEQYRQRRAERRPDTCTLVFTSQGYDVENVVTFLSEFVRLAQDRLHFELYIKLHPGETTKVQYAALDQLGDHIHVLLSSEPPSTFELLALADLHLSIFSTCHFEALALGVPTVILPLAGYEAVLELHAAGHAALAATPADLLELARRARNETVPASVGEFYFTSGTLENMKQELGLETT